MSFIFVPTLKFYQMSLIVYLNLLFNVPFLAIVGINMYLEKLRIPAFTLYVQILYGSFFYEFLWIILCLICFQHGQPKMLTFYCALCDTISMNYKINFKEKLRTFGKSYLNGKSSGIIIDWPHWLCHGNSWKHWKSAKKFLFIWV